MVNYYETENKSNTHYELYTHVQNTYTHARVQELLEVITFLRLTRTSVRQA